MGNRAKVRTHGQTGTRLHNEWRGIKYRCYNHNFIEYERYGGRGITVCDEWLNSFEAFQDWALANGYRDNLTIDRIDNNGPYSPENCCWKTLKDQQNNRSNNRLIEHEGKTMTMKQWSENKGIPYSTLRRRLDCGWDVETALTKPVRKKARNLQRTR